jgi:hypothetical protein
VEPDGFTTTTRAVRDSAEQAEAVPEWAVKAARLIAGDIWDVNPALMLDVTKRYADIIWQAAREHAPAPATGDGCLFCGKPRLWQWRSPKA